MHKLEAALQATGIPTAYFGWSHAPAGDYIAWGEDYARDFVSNGIHAERGTRCFVSLFTRDGSGATRRTVENALNGLRCPWRLSMGRYENDSGYIHFEWRVSIYGDTEVPTNGEDQG